MIRRGLTSILPSDPIDEQTRRPAAHGPGVVQDHSRSAPSCCALTYAAWLIPIGWLKWPAVIVAGFVAAAGLFVLGAMIAGILGFIDVNEGRTPCAQDEPPL